MRQNQHHRDEHEPLPCHSQQRCPHDAADVLVEHVGHGHDGHEREGAALAAHGGTAEPDDIGIVPEQSDQPRREREAQAGGKKQECNTHTQAEDVCRAYT